MTERFDPERLLEGINKNIEITEKQIDDLQAELNELHQGEATISFRKITQKLSVLKENLHLLKVRRVYILGSDFSPKK